MMKVHHMATILLLAVSWSHNFHFYGCFVLFIHDVSDVPMFAVRLLRDSAAPHAKAKQLFVVPVLLFTWIYYRVGWLGVLIVQLAVTTANGAFVYLVEGGKAKRMAVKVGRPSGTLVKLDSGLVGGEQVIIEGQNRLQDGAKVELRGSLSKGGPSGASRGSTGRGNRGAGGAAGAGGGGGAGGKRGAAQ
jgi:hypothetical protein